MMTERRFIPMRMIFQSIEVVTFHDDAESIARKIHDATGLRVVVWENESEGDTLVRRDKLMEVK